MYGTKSRNLAANGPLNPKKTTPTSAPHDERSTTQPSLLYRPADARPPESGTHLDDDVEASKDREFVCNRTG
ncbi:hypothetical protein BS297_11730 [Rhodococcus erythropolis]|uniref:Uncharacterized protein n=1 Tax=Rhodococcus erythropolis TaxID=1833 RepID=A0A0C2ZNI0_RHOER|nr:hypothetical protein BS297_11730 [Rhodococcus erythropolis]KIM14420.1 hypothetical protein QV65_32200 [Rhodococcus erythropolis]